MLLDRQKSDYFPKVEYLVFNQRCQDRTEIVQFSFLRYFFYHRHRAVAYDGFCIKSLRRYVYDNLLGMDAGLGSNFAFGMRRLKRTHYPQRYD